MFLKPSYSAPENYCKCPSALYYALCLLCIILLPDPLAQGAEEHGKGYPEIPIDPSHYMEHDVVLDAHGRLLPWTSYQHVLEWSIKYINDGPTYRTRHGLDPQYLVSSCMKPDGSIKLNQHNLGSTAYFAVETLLRYYPYSGDQRLIESVRLLLDRLRQYHSSKDAAWPDIPPSQDDTPDGCYTDEWTGVVQSCMIGVAYTRFYRLTGEAFYLEAAQGIAKTMAAHVSAGDATHSPLPFRVNLRTGKILAEHSAAMVFPVMLFYELEAADPSGKYSLVRKALWDWVLAYPVKNHRWFGFFEDVDNVRVNESNLDQLIPLETARFMLQHPSLDPDYRQHVPALLDWVKDRFGKTRRYGATSIREQDVYPLEMTSHTARYAAVRALWYAVSKNPADKEEARAAVALTTYGVKNKHSPAGMALNWTGPVYHALNWANWYTDCYFDYLPHVLDCLGAIPEMALEGGAKPENHLLRSSSIITQINYRPYEIEYVTHDPEGQELLILTFNPLVLAEGKPLAHSQWNYGTYEGVSNVLQIRRTAARHILVRSQKAEH